MRRFSRVIRPVRRRCRGMFQDASRPLVERGGDESRHLTDGAWDETRRNAGFSWFIGSAADGVAQSPKMSYFSLLSAVVMIRGPSWMRCMGRNEALCGASVNHPAGTAPRPTPQKPGSPRLYIRGGSPTTAISSSFWKTPPRCQIGVAGMRSSTPPAKTGYRFNRSRCT